MNKKFLKFKCKEILEEEDDYTGILVDYDLLNHRDKEELIHSVEFRINKEAIRNNTEENSNEPCWKLIDRQGANLGNIEDDEFNIGDYDSIVDRLGIYWHDYGYYFKNEMENYKYDIVS